MRLWSGTMHAAFEVLFSGFVQLQCMVVANNSHCHKNNPFNIIILSLYNGLVCDVILRGFVEAARTVATCGSVKGDDS